MKDDTVQIDARHLLCPLPVLKARKALIAMAPGQVLTIITTDAMAVIDLPHFCTEAGHEVIEQVTTGAETRWRIRCGINAASAPAPGPDHPAC